MKKLTKKSHVDDFPGFTKSCGNCFWFSDEDMSGLGFCEEWEMLKMCDEYCPRWNRRASDDSTRN